MLVNTTGNIAVRYKYIYTFLKKPIQSGTTHPYTHSLYLRPHFENHSCMKQLWRHSNYISTKTVRPQESPYKYITQMGNVQPWRKGLEVLNDFITKPTVLLTIDSFGMLRLTMNFTTELDMTTKQTNKQLSVCCVQTTVTNEDTNNNNFLEMLRNIHNISISIRKYIIDWLLL